MDENTYTWEGEKKTLLLLLHGHAHALKAPTEISLRHLLPLLSPFHLPGLPLQFLRLGSLSGRLFFLSGGRLLEASGLRQLQ